jgi:uncharacterized protein (TIGR03067 family)
MRFHAGLVSLVSLTAAAGAQSPADKERMQLQGKWEIVSITSKAGKEEPKPGQMLSIIAGDKIISKEGAKTSGEANFMLDPGKTPKTIDLRPIGGDDKGKTFLGIYELTGTDLKMCFGPANGPRPTEFTSLPNQSLIVMRRLKE